MRLTPRDLYQILDKLPTHYWNLYLNYLYSSKHKHTTYKSLNSQWPLATSENWTFLNLNTVPNLYLFSQSPKGLFYTITNSLNELNNWSYHNELKWLLNSTQNQTVFVKFSRWLYKYNLLHRKVFISSHKNTLSKRLLGSGFYDSQFDTRNIQCASLKDLNPNYTNWISSTYHSIYGQNNRPANNLNLEGYSTPNLWASTTLNSLNFQEDSYFWLLKRFYSFNNLNATKQESTLFLTQNKPLLHLTKQPLVDATSLRIKHVLQKNLNFSKNPLNGVGSTQPRTTTESKSVRDVNVLLSTSWPTFYTQDLTEIFSWLLTSNTSRQNTYFYYSYFLTKPYSTFDSSIKSLK